MLSGSLRLLFVLTSSAGTETVTVSTSQSTRSERRESDNRLTAAAGDRSNRLNVGEGVGTG